MQNPNAQSYDININTYNPDELRQICHKLESMTKINQVEALRIFYKHKKDIINENKYGIHINVTDIDTHVMKEIEEFIVYVSKQEKELNDIEELQQDMQVKYMHKSY